jgi:hypothetical protein
MKQLSIFILLLFFSYAFKAQEVNDSIPKSYELKDPQYSAFRKIEQEWFAKEYGKILKENKLKMNCNGCESVFMNTVFEIDSAGKLKNYKVVNSRKCHGAVFSKKLEERFIKWFLSYPFPAELYNSKFEARLGTGLKC